MVEKENINVLFLTLYSIKNPRHGGEHRASNIVSYYKKKGILCSIIYAMSRKDFGDMTESKLDNDYSIFPEKEVEKLKYTAVVEEI